MTPSTSRYDSALDFAGHYLGPHGEGFYACLMRGVDLGTLTFEEALAAIGRAQREKAELVEERRQMANNDHEDDGA